MKILVTGFDPFGGEKINPAFEVIKRLKSHIDGAEII
ncbi:MAG TPA: pyroglutamyl-peptidase I, partial [Clostridiaceae bacterium]|nr:pyroglutamyl-peptidase I [Clostridiaceae bacterium]HBX48276.1 pyroglutamyl-peptidase I [Clostridiaceae bacterium]